METNIMETNIMETNIMETQVMETSVIDTGVNAESIISDELQVFPVAASYGDAVRQGDIYICLLERLPADCKVMVNQPSQLAPGTTQGSRHCLDSLANVTAYQLANPGDYDGPVLDVRGEGCVITHPEHGDFKLGAGIYGIGFQRTVDSEGRIRRVRD